MGKIVWTKALILDWLGDPDNLRGYEFKEIVGKWRGNLTKVKLVCQDTWITDIRNLKASLNFYSKVTGKFDYITPEISSYTGSGAKVTFVCKYHGNFEMNATSIYKSKIPCPCCRKEHSWRNFINTAKKVHKDKYYYFYEDFNTVDDKIRILCKKHGIFLQSPEKHGNQKRSCPSCALEASAKRNTTSFEEFVRLSNKIHGSKFKYYEDSYQKSSSKTKIYCTEHDVEFYQLPHLHIKGAGCSLCTKDKLKIHTDKSKLTTGQFIQKSREVHGNIFDYSITEYKTYKDPVKIICKIHGVFEQKAVDHLNGGCLRCARDNSVGSYNLTKIYRDIEYYTNKSCDLYLIHLPDIHKNAYKIGISSYIKNRFSTIKAQAKSSGTICKLYPTNVKNAFILEQQFHEYFADRRLPTTYPKFTGSTEVFILNTDELSYVEDTFDDLNTYNNTFNI